MNENFNNVEEGKIRKVILTLFGNLAQPFVRYNTADLTVFCAIEKAFFCNK